MKRFALLLLFAAATVIAAPAFADQFLVGFTGFDYEDPNVNPAVYLDPATSPPEGYKVVGFVTAAGTLLTGVIDFTNDENTFYLFDLTSTFSNFDGRYIQVACANNGRMRFFADPYSSGGHTPAVYGINPPNGSVPSTFVDATLKLGGRVDNFALVYDTQEATGNYYGTLEIDEGSALGSIPVGQRSGWTLAGQAGAPNATVPQGYDHQISGECDVPDATPANQKTWGAIKALYRR